jgi:PAS domain S-box-containing protein
MWLRSFSIQFKVLLGFTLAMLGIGYFLYTTYENAQFSIQESSANKDQLKVMLQVEDISTEMQDIENAYRGYVITGDSTYLFPGFKARTAVNKDLTALLESTKINEAQHQLALQLSENSKVFFAHVDSIVNFMDRGDIKNAVALVKSNRGKKDMQIIQSCTSQIENHGRSFLNEANVKKEQIASHTRSNFLTLSLVLLLNLFVVYLIIIHDLKKNEESKFQLKKANETILNIYDEAPNGYLTLDPNGVILDINQTAVKWFNYPIEEIAGKMKFGSLFVSPKFNSIEDAFFKTPFSNLEADLVSVKGELIEFLIDTRVIFSPDGELNCVRVTLTCYRDLKKAQKQSKYLAMLIENTNDAIVSVNADLTIKTWNKGAEKMYGFDESEAIGKNFVELLQIEAKEKDYDDMWKSLERSGTWSSEAKHYKKGGAPIYVLNSVSKFTISNQNDILLISITKDITDHKLYQRSLRRFNEELLTKVEEKTEELTNIFTRISEGFVSLDKNLNFIYVNPFAENFLQKKKEELLGKNIFDFYEILPNTAFRTKIFNSIRNKEFLEIEQYSVFFQKWIHLRIFPSEAGTSFFSARHNGEKGI